MAIYMSSHPGVTLDALTITNLNLQPKDLRGYFSKQDLRSLLNNHPNCAGLRFYNVNPTTNFPALLAVCVMNNGADMQEDNTHSICNPTNLPSNVSSLQPRLDAYNGIKEAYTFDVAESEKFSSYFSRTMIQALMDNNTQDGICFYKVVWLAGRSTHLAVTTNLRDDGNGGQEIIGVLEPGFNNRLSDQPCPGHCVTKDANEELSPIANPKPFVNKIKDQIDDPYIPIWD